jgi:hypothetical protein
MTANPETVATTGRSVGHDPIGMPEAAVTLQFAEQDGKTTITNRTRFTSAEDLETVLAMGMIEGLTQT